MPRRTTAYAMVAASLVGLASPGWAERAITTGPAQVIDVNRPRTPNDCDIPIGIQWYGSRSRCLAEMCAGLNVYNEYLFDTAQRRKNPCYGQSPTEFDPR